MYFVLVGIFGDWGWTFTIPSHLDLTCSVLMCVRLKWYSLLLDCRDVNIFNGLLVTDTTGRLDITHHNDAVVIIIATSGEEVGTRPNSWKYSHIGRNNKNVSGLWRLKRCDAWWRSTESSQESGVCCHRAQCQKQPDTKVDFKSLFFGAKNGRWASGPSDGGQESGAQTNVLYEHKVLLFHY